MELSFSFNNNSIGRATAKARKEAYQKAYDAWAREMIIKQQYNIGIKQIMNKLHVSDYWIRTHLCSALDYIKVNPSKLEELGFDSHSTLLFREADLRKQLVSISVFTRQTIVIDLIKEVNKDKIMRAAELNPSVLAFDEANKNAYGKRADVLLEMLDNKYENVNERKRSDYPEVAVEPFDFWTYPLHFSDDYPNRERAYRDFFLRGFIKIALQGKSIFVLKEDLDKVIYPLTVKYTAN